MVRVPSPHLPLYKEELRQFIKNALDEDIGRGDLTTLACIAADQNLSAIMQAREKMVIAGIELAAEIFHTTDPSLRLNILAHDGVLIQKGSNILEIEGNARSILSAERTALNILQYLSGIATLTHEYVQKISHTDCQLLDTRKTLPLYRKLAKYASKLGGAKNHRMRLDDGVMIKDNHIAHIGSVKAAIMAVKAHDISDSTIGITVECDTLEQAEEAVKAGATRLLLDNMSLENLTLAVKKYKYTVELEASGGVTLETIKSIAETGVDFISVGRITQSAPAVDIGLDYLD